MKLLFCPRCGDVFQLRVNKIRECECGFVKGQYIDNRMAEVSPGSISLAIGNGSLMSSIVDMETHKAETKDKAPREDYYELGKGKITYAWVRPNFGPGNPHTKLIEDPNG